MACGADLLVDGFGRVHEVVHQVVDGLTGEQASRRLGPNANSISWLIWHLTRVQDDHLADAAGTEQCWFADGWDARFDMTGEAAIGYGHTSEQAAGVAVEPELLLDYHDAVYRLTVGYLGGLADDDLDRVVDTRWDPPVTLGVRLVSVLSDDLQHAGQAAFIRGVLPGNG